MTKKRFHGDANKVVAKGNGLKKAFPNRPANFTLECKDAGLYFIELLFHIALHISIHIFLNFQVKDYCSLELSHQLEIHWKRSVQKGQDQHPTNATIKRRRRANIHLPLDGALTKSLAAPFTISV